MGAVTPTKTVNLSLGNRDAVVAAFTAIANAEYWDCGLADIEHVSITGDNSGNETHGCTTSSGRVTFAASAQLDNVTVLAIGFK